MTTAMPTNQELQALEILRAHRRRHREGLPIKISTHIEQPTVPLTIGQEISDKVAKTVGSWKFIIIQSICISAWIVYNSINNANVWDPYPFILLNLMLSLRISAQRDRSFQVNDRAFQSERDRLFQIQRDRFCAFP